MAARKVTVVLSGGAPNGALTAGALCGIYEAGKTFHTFYASGAGAVFGLLTIAPKSGDAAAALEATTRVGIHDAIYEFVPLGYKTFFKSGPFTFPIKKFIDHFKRDEVIDKKKDNFARFYNDWLDLWAAIVTPTFVNPRSEGLCAPFPFADDFIEFGAVSKFKGQFYMNAYCIETGITEQFTHKQITVEHFRAALAFPFIYPPAEVGAKHYYEGSAVDPLNLPELWARIERGDIPGERHTIVLIDVLGELQKALIRRPRHLVDAYGISIITPVVSLAQAKLDLFRCERQEQIKQKQIELIKLPFDIKEERYPTLTDWSRTNLEELFKIGRDAGNRFAEIHRDQLPDHAPGSADPVESDEGSGVGTSRPSANDSFSDRH
jgi:NTE family protein